MPACANGAEGASEGRRAFCTLAASARFHTVLVVVGAVFLLAGAFHGNVWFDESYSVGIANHSFADIWAIGEGDVHPVLVYVALHVLNLLFGQNILAYRLFALAGAVALGVLGRTVVRSDFGASAGLLFTFFALFTPYVTDMSIEIRMYSWAVFAVAACALFAWRVFSCVRGRDESGRPVRAGAEVRAGSIRARARGMRCWGGAPRRWWLAFFAASLASAYLHYFGVLSAFVVNLLLFGYLLVRWAVSRARRGRDAFARAGAHEGAAANSAVAEDSAPGGRTPVARALPVFLAGAVAQVAAYAPWFPALQTQLSVVSDTYWANFTFPTTLIELGTYPILTSAVSFAQRGQYGALPQTALAVLVWAFVVAALAILACVLARGLRAAFLRLRGVAGQGRPARAQFAAWLCSDGVLACILAFGAYLGVFVVADTASRLANSFLLYYRYLFVAFGLLVLGVSLLAARAARRRAGAVAVAVLCACVLGISAVNQAISLSDNYAPANQAPLEAFEEACAWAEGAPFGYANEGDDGEDAVEAGDRALEGEQALSAAAEEAAPGDAAANAPNGASGTEAPASPADANGALAPDADTPLAYRENADFAATVDAPLVLSSDIGIQGVMAVTYPEIAQTYMDWQPGNWALSYRAYAPTLTSVKTWEVALDGYEGRFVVLGQSQDGSVPRDVTDLAQKPGVSCIDVQTFYRPYERTYFTIARMEKTQG